MLSLLGAAAVGAVIALLVAPEKGSELRSKIQTAANDWADQLGDLVSSSKKKFGEMKGEMKARAENGVAGVQENL